MKFDFDCSVTPSGWLPVVTPFNASALPPLPTFGASITPFILDGPYYSVPVDEGAPSIQQLAQDGDRKLGQVTESLIGYKYPQLSHKRRTALYKVLNSNNLLSYLAAAYRLDALIPMSYEKRFQKTGGDQFEAFVGACLFDIEHSDAKDKRVLEYQLEGWLSTLFEEDVIPLLGYVGRSDLAPIPAVHRVPDRHAVPPAQRFTCPKPKSPCKTKAIRPTRKPRLHAAPMMGVCS